MRLLRLWRLVGQDARLLLQALRRADRPRWLLPVLILMVVFALDPFNFALPTLGILDDLILLPLMMRAVVKLAGADRQGPPA
jgi:uncharacterized membrane protein YkvA (DUF1232 family)